MVKLWAKVFFDAQLSVERRNPNEQLLHHFDGVIPMVRCYSIGETYEQSEIRWTLKSKIPKDIGFDVENIRGDDLLQDFLPNAHQLGEEIEA